MADNLASVAAGSLRNLRENGQWEKILTVTQELSAANLLTLSHTAEYCFALANLNKYDQAENVALQVLHADPSNFLALRTRVLVCMGQQKLKEALLLAQSVFTTPFVFSAAEEAAQAVLTLASVHNALGEHQKSVALAKESIRIHPLSTAFGLLAISEFLLGNYRDSEIACVKSLTMRSNPHIWSVLANIHTKSGCIEKITHTYEAALKEHPREVLFLATLGEWYTRIHKYKEAETVLQKATTINPNFLNGWVNYGKLMFIEKKSIECEFAFAQALRIAPNNPEMLYNISQIYEKQEKHTESLKYISEAYKIAPEKDDIALFFAFCNEKNGNSKTADTVLNEVLLRTPNASKAMWTQAKIAILREQFNLGVSLFQNAIECEQKYLAQQPHLSFFGDGAHPPMDVFNASETLIAVCQFLEQLKVPYFLIAGTLLGIVRDGELLPHDKDADLGIAWDVDRNWLLKQFEDSDEFDLNGIQPKSEKAMWNFAVVRKGTPIGVDLFFQKPDGDDWLSGFHAKPSPWCHRFKQRKLTTIEYKGHLLPIPENPEEYLEEVYGPDWRIPMPSYDTLIAAENLCPEAYLTAKIIGYNRLYDVLRTRSWKKVLWYCEALKRFDNPPILDELAGWLRGALASTSSENDSKK